MASRNARRIRAAVAGLMCAAGLAGLGACTSDGPGSWPGQSRKSTGPRAQGATGAVTIDGDVGEWATGVVATADEAYLYVRFSVEEKGESTLQAANHTVTVHLDIDGSGGTGATMLDPVDAAGMGVDVEIAFSPRGADGSLERGVAAFVVDGNGARTRVPAAALDVCFAPTHAAPWYEMRISRHVAAGTDMSALERAGAWEGVITLRDTSGKLVGWSDAFLAQKPEASAQPPLADASLPAKPEGAIRVLNWNIHRNAPEKSPAGFVRVIEATRPDVIVLQEWEAESPDQIRRWFHEHLESPTGSWHALSGKAWGVAIVAPHEITPLVRDGVTFPRGGREHRARVAAGVVPLAEGDIVLASVHLKCCGAAGTDEDATRIAEGRAIAAALGRAVERDPTWVRVVAGDMNLVGTRTPLDEIGRGLDVDGSDLEIAPVRVLGDRATYTWVDWSTSFTPGRLDWVLYSGAGSVVENAFSIDTRRLSEASLARMGLDRGDSGSSDHLPVVVDVRIRK